MKTLQALLLAPPVAAISMTLLLIYSDGSRGPSEIGIPFLGYVLAAIAVSYVGTAVVGVPVHLLLQRWQRRRLSDYAIAGTALPLIGVAAFFVYVVRHDALNFPALGVMGAVRHNGGTFASIGLLFGGCGLLVSTAFWAVAVKSWEPK